jgi:hypothetical protein
MFAPIGLSTGFKCDLPPGMHEVSFELKLPYLAEGRYFLDLMVVESGFKFYDYLEEAIAFSVLADHRASTGWRFSQARGQGSVLLDTSTPEVTAIAAAEAMERPCLPAGVGDQPSNV